MKETLGLIVNPVAGMGGSVGLKGTDGEMYKRALELNASPVTPKRTRDLLSHIRNRGSIELLVPVAKTLLGIDAIFEGVLVSDLSGQLSPGFIRVSVGTPEENDVFLDSYTKILEEEDSRRLFSTNHTNHA